MRKIKTRLRKLIATMTLNSMSVIGLSQDTIIMSDQTQIISKVMEISPVEIKYKRFNNMDGPEYLITKEEVLLIKYKNGTPDSFPVVKPWLRPVKKANKEFMSEAEPKSLVSSTINFDGNFYSFKNENLSENQMQNVLKEKNNPELNKYVLNARLSRGFQPLTNLGFPAVTVGAVMVLLAQNQVWKQQENDDNMNIGKSLITFSGVCLGASFYLHYNIKKQNKKAVALYNQLY